MRRFLAPRWLVRHAAVLVLVAAFLGLGWWQIRRAAAGNMLSYGYAVEWPVFALFVIGIWLREIRLERRGHRAGAGTGPGMAPERGTDRETPADVSAAGPGGDDPGPAATEPGGPGVAVDPVAAGDADDLLVSVPRRAHRRVDAEDGDPGLRAYNEYLAWLNADPNRRPGDYPGPVDR